MNRNVVHTRRVVIGLLICFAFIATADRRANAQTLTPATDVHFDNARLRAPQVRKFRVPAGKAASIATHLGLKYQSVEGVQVSFDPRTNQLIVMAPPAVQQQIAGEVQSLIQPGADPSDTGVATHMLQNIYWRQFEADFKQITSTPPSVTQSRQGERATYRLAEGVLAGSTIEVDRSGGMITVSSAPSKIDGWKKLIAAIDQPLANADGITSIIKLKNAEPAPIQRAIRLLGKLEDRVRRSDDLQVNSKPPSSPFRTAVFQQDAAADAGGDEAETPTESGAGIIGDTQIEFVPELGTIIIKGSKRDVERVREVIKQIEEQSEVTKPDVEVVPLQHADSNAVATLLEQLYEDVLSARQGSVSITSLDAPNALLLIGRSEAIKSLLELVSKIDQPVSDSSRMRVFRLQHASALDAEQTIRDFFSDRPGTGDDLRPGLGFRVRVLADYRTNSLIISASPRDMEEVSRLINDLDVQDTSSQNQIKVFPLNNALADELAPVIQNAINGEGEGDDANITNPSATLSIVNLDSGKGETLNSGILAGATVTADPGANAIVVRAPVNSMALIGELIRQLDQAPGIDSLVKVFTIENGDALQLATALQDLFGDDAATSGTSIGAGNAASLPSLAGASDSTLVPLRFSTDQRTNSIVASGSSEDLEVVESILLRLDSAGFADRITEVVWLRHQGSDAVAAALTNYVQQRTQSVNVIQQFQQGLGPYDLPDRDLIVVSEPVTNSVLLSVSPRLYEDVRRLIDRLDRRQPMVMIKVVLAEVSLDDTFEIGGELGLQDSLVYDRGIAAGAFPGATAPSTPGFNFNNNGLTNLNSFGQNSLAGRGVSSFGVGTTNSALGYGGFVLSAASDSVNMLLRTLQDANRLQVLSRPQVMTVDNTEAAVQVGRQVARIRDVTQNVQGSLVSTEDIQVGLILQIRPRVGADGLITMDVDVERSARDLANGTPIPDGNGSVIVIDDIITTNAQSVVAAFDGQTVVYGGLIQKTRSNFSRRVPIVADIPLIGNMFKYDQETESRSELLIFLTPMLVTGEEDLEYVKQVESSRMSWCLADVVEMHGDVGLSGGYGLWGPAVGQTIYPDIQPTIDDVIIHDDYSVDTYPSPVGSSIQHQSAVQGMSSPGGFSPGNAATPVMEGPVIQMPGSGIPAAGQPMNLPQPIAPMSGTSPQASVATPAAAAAASTAGLSAAPSYALPTMNSENAQVSWQKMLESSAASSAAAPTNQKQ